MLEHEQPQHNGLYPCGGSRNCRYSVDKSNYEGTQWGFMVDSWRDPEEMEELMEQVEVSTILPATAGACAGRCRYCKLRGIEVASIVMIVG